MKHGIQIQYNDNFENAIKAAGNAGFRYVSVGFGTSDCFNFDNWEKDIAKISTILEKNNIECIQTHIPYYSLLISAEEHDPVLDLAQLRCMEASAKLGAEWVAYHPRTAINDDCSPKKSLEYEKKAVVPLIEAAEKYDTGLALENLPIFPGCSISHLNFFSSNYEDLITFHDYLNNPHVSICWDFGHAHLMKWNDEVLPIKTVGDRIKCTHIHTNHQSRDDHLPPVMCNTEWKPIMDEFKKFYKGALMLEVVYPDTVPLESYFRFCKDNLEYLDNL